MRVEELYFEECVKILSQKRFGRLACSLNDKPHIIPLNFVFDEKNHLYAFSNFEKEINWMRENPSVCLELDDFENKNDCTLINVSGRFEELPDNPELCKSSRFFQELVLKDTTCWHPTYTAEVKHKESTESPIYFQIHIEKISGHRIVAEVKKVLFDANESVYPRKNYVWGIW